MFDLSIDRRDGVVFSCVDHMLRDRHCHHGNSTSASDEVETDRPGVAFAVAVSVPDSSGKLRHLARVVQIERFNVRFD